LLLLASSLFMLRCVQASLAGAFWAAMTNALITAGLGVAFLSAKIAAVSPAAVRGGQAG
jgi:heme/copper-type cytochrome/quinol oxidase subunit 3